MENAPLETFNFVPHRVGNSQRGFLRFLAPVFAGAMAAVIRIYFDVIRRGWCREV